jgi:hypothetical protein
MDQLEEAGKGRWEGFMDKAKAGITMKLKREMFTVIFFLACIAASELEQVVLEEI